MARRSEDDRWARFRRLLDYYLECVEEDGRQEFIFESTANHPSFVPMDLPREWNLLEGPEAERVGSFPLQRLELGNQYRGEKVQLFYGYPVLASWEALPERGTPACCYAPLFFQPVERVPGRLFERHDPKYRLASDWPRPNRAAFQRLFGSSEEQNVVLERLGLLDWSTDLQDLRIPEAVQRLVDLGLELPVEEPLDPAETRALAIHLARQDRAP